MATIASVYANAVFEVAQEKKQLESVVQELKEFAEALQTSAALRASLGGAGVDPQKRLAILGDVMNALSMSPLVKRFLEVLASKGRILVVPEILQDLETRMEADRGIVSGHVRSAVELSPDELAVLSKALEKRVGKKIRLAQSTDPNLLGGVVATVAGKTFDASLRTQIERFRNELI